MEFDIKGDAKSVIIDLSQNLPSKVKRAHVRAINDTVKHVTTQAKRGVAQETGIAQKRFSRRISGFKYNESKGKAKVWGGYAVGFSPSKLSKAQKLPAKFEKMSNLNSFGKTRVDTFRADLGFGSHFYVRVGEERYDIRRVQLFVGDAMRVHIPRAGLMYGPAQYQKRAAHHLKNLKRIERNRFKKQARKKIGKTIKGIR